MLFYVYISNQQNVINYNIMLHNSPKYKMPILNNIVIFYRIFYSQSIGY